MSRYFSLPFLKIYSIRPSASCCIKVNPPVIPSAAAHVGDPHALHLCTFLHLSASNYALQLCRTKWAVPVIFYGITPPLQSQHHRTANQPYSTTQLASQPSIILFSA